MVTLLYPLDSSKHDLFLSRGTTQIKNHPVILTFSTIELKFTTIHSLNFEKNENFIKVGQIDPGFPGRGGIPGKG